MKPILEVHNIGKRYSIRHQSGGYLSLRERLLEIFRIGGEAKEDFWALKNVSFEVHPGESLGIIGRNGAGKSTLLKILSRITPPSTGRIIARGRIASLLEVGTGFHPELTGRENIFFNGSLLGMKRREIESRFDEIVDFSGVERFLDTPLKHYSSGMQLRLAFAVAAFLEPEILVIDEVLAVGDAEFQKKCLGKMEDVSRSGRTILFVSHDLTAIERLCSSNILLSSGTVVEKGETEKVIARYLQKPRATSAARHVADGVRLSVELGSNAIVSDSMVTVAVSMTFEGIQPIVTELCLILYSIKGVRVGILDFRQYFDSFEKTSSSLLLNGAIQRLNLVEGEYTLAVHYSINGQIGEMQDLTSLTITSHNSGRSYEAKYRGLIELAFTT